MIPNVSYTASGRSLYTSKIWGGAESPTQYTVSVSNTVQAAGRYAIDAVYPQHILAQVRLRAGSRRAQIIPVRAAVYVPHVWQRILRRPVWYVPRDAAGSPPVGGCIIAGAGTAPSRRPGRRIRPLYTRRGRPPRTAQSRLPRRAWCGAAPQEGRRLCALRHAGEGPVSRMPSHMLRCRRRRTQSRSRRTCLRAARSRWPRATQMTGGSPPPVSGHLANSTTITAPMIVAAAGTAMASHCIRSGLKRRRRFRRFRRSGGLSRAGVLPSYLFGRARRCPRGGLWNGAMRSSARDRSLSIQEPASRVWRRIAGAWISTVGPEGMRPKFQPDARRINGRAVHICQWPTGMPIMTG